MIVRIVRGRTEPERLDEVRAALAVAGLLHGAWRADVERSHAWVRIDDKPPEIAWLDFHAAPGDSSLAAGSGGGRDPAAVLRPLAQDVTVAHFELEEPLIRESRTEPTILRLTVGRFSRRGADLEMQDLLRQRLPSVRPEMTEAYVGRRIVGRAVEVTFFSTWTEDPGDLDLHEPLWPDIAIRYDTFYLGLYRALAESIRE